MNKPQEAFPYNPRQVQDLKKLVAQGEGSFLEFKRKATYPDKIIREMIAFANTRGGVLLLGVGDDRSLPGLKFPEDESHVIHEALKKSSPGYPSKNSLFPSAMREPLSGTTLQKALPNLITSTPVIKKNLMCG